MEQNASKVCIFFYQLLVLRNIAILVRSIKDPVKFVRVVLVLFVIERNAEARVMFDL